MRIGVFNWRCFRHPQSGGAELYLHEQAKRWVENGHEVVWFTSRPSHPKGVEKTETADGIQFRRAGGAFSIYPLAALNYLREPAVDVIIDAENGIPFFTPLFSRKPIWLLIYHVHEDVWRREASWPVARLGEFLERRVMPWVYAKKSVVTISQSSAEMIRTLFGPDKPIEIITSGINPPDSLDIEKAEQPEIIYLGRLRKYKSVDTLLHAVKQIEDLNPVLRLVGRGEDEPRLRILADSLALKNVHFEGFVNEVKKTTLLQQAWVAVNPSSMEGWGITNIEANACGTPVIGADVPGIRDSVSVGKSGFLYPHGDADALAGLLRKLISEETERSALSESSKLWAFGFSWDKAAAKWIEQLEPDRSKEQTS